MLDGLIQSILGLLKLGCLTRIVLTIAWIAAWLGITLTTQSGPFEATIDRQANSPREEALISTAEAICPDPALLDQGCDDAAEGECQWWCGEFDGYRIPYGVTGAAWRYYQDELGKLQQGSESHHVQPRTSATLRYRARVEPVSGHPVVTDRVMLDLIWSFSCGPVCGQYITMHRLVYFDAEGNVVEVQGDGRPSIFVS